ncbi:MAG: SPOR domain-containing protein [Deinococcus sp.]|nr:SPOR domain-containing protein [Deinococcus sp.]
MQGTARLATQRIRRRWDPTPQPQKPSLGDVLTLIALLLILVQGTAWIYHFLGPSIREMLARRATPAAVLPPEEPPPVAAPAQPAAPPQAIAPAVPPAPSRSLGAANGNFSVQVMAVARASDAQRIARQLNQETGYRTFVVSGRWQQVRIGYFQTRDEAEQARRDMVTQGYADALILQVQ